MLSKTNSLKSGKYRFQPTRYDDNGNLYCALYRRCSNRYVCKLTILYSFEDMSYRIIWVADGWLNHRHGKMLEWFLNEYEWI